MASKPPQPCLTIPLSLANSSHSGLIHTFRHFTIPDADFEKADYPYATRVSGVDDPQHIIHFSEFRAPFGPKDDFGCPGDVWIDVFPKKYGLYAKAKTKWTKWPGRTGHLTSMIVHPYFPMFLWCTEAGVTWTNYTQTLIFDGTLDPSPNSAPDVLAKFLAREVESRESDRMYPETEGSSRTHGQTDTPVVSRQVEPEQAASGRPTIIQNPLLDIPVTRPTFEENMAVLSNENKRLTEELAQLRARNASKYHSPFRDVVLAIAGEQSFSEDILDIFRDNTITSLLERLEGTQKQMENAQKELQASNTANSTLNSKYRQVESDSHSLRLQLGEAQDELQAAKGQIRDLEESLRQSSLNQKSPNITPSTPSHPPVSLTAPMEDLVVDDPPIDAISAGVGNVLRIRSQSPHVAEKGRKLDVDSIDPLQSNSALNTDPSQETLNSTFTSSLVALPSSSGVIAPSAERMSELLDSRKRKASEDVGSPGQKSKFARTVDHRMSEDVDATHPIMETAAITNSQNRSSSTAAIPLKLEDPEPDIPWPCTSATLGPYARLYEIRGGRFYCLLCYKIREKSASQKIAKFSINSSLETLVEHGKTAHPKECTILAAKFSATVH